MSWFQGAIPKSPAEVADNLDLWEKSGTIRANGYLRRALRRAAGTIRELVAERDALRGQLTRIEAERRGQA